MFDLPSNATRFYNLFEFANTATSDWFGVSFAVLIWVVAFFSMKNFDTPRAFAFASTVSAVLSILLMAAGLIGGYLVSIFVIMSALSVIYLFKAS